MKNLQASAFSCLLVIGVGMTVILPNLNAAPPKKTVKPAVKSISSQPVAGDDTPLTEDQKIAHVLSRLGYGARPGDIERIRQIGLKTYIYQQLQPEQIADADVESHLSEFTVLQEPANQLAQKYTEGLRAVRELQKAAQKAQFAKQAQMTDAAGDAKMADTMTAEDSTQKKSAQKREALANLTEEQRQRLQQLRQQGAGKSGIGGGIIQLTNAKIIRAVESQKQLNEVMADFWSNHFNIDIRKSQCRVLKIADDRDVIRKYQWGRFRDFLGASAKSPAMLVYLDNYQSSVPRTIPVRVQQRMQGNPNLAKVMQRAQGGINENYAREIMELHTLGVDGGYTQKDVQEVARCLTGWTIQRGQGAFEFDARRHDNGEKTVLGHQIPAGGGIQDGETVLDILASHPATIKHISTQLCQKLVADGPPTSIVNKCIATWQRTDGNLREVVRTIVTSPEFFSRAAYRQKIKSPFEFAVSAIRALGGTVAIGADGLQIRYAALKDNGKGGGVLQARLPGQISAMGEPLFQCQPPTGYSTDSRKWISTGALIARLNYALRLTTGQIPDADLMATHSLVPASQTPAENVNFLGNLLLHGEMTPPTRATILKEVKASQTSGDSIGTRRIAALILGSPEFQRR